MRIAGMAHTYDGGWWTPIELEFEVLKESGDVGVKGAARGRRLGFATKTEARDADSYLIHLTKSHRRVSIRLRGRGQRSDDTWALVECSFFVINYIQLIFIFNSISSLDFGRLVLCCVCFAAFFSFDFLVN